MINISIVLFNNKQEQINKLLGDILCSRNIAISKIFLIDNSPLDTLRTLVLQSSLIEYIHTPNNLGYGQAHNVAINESIRDNTLYHLVVNPDIRFEKDVLGNIAMFMNENVRYGLLMPKILYPDGKLQYLCKLLPTPLELLVRRFLPQRMVDKINYDYCLKWTNYNKIMEVPYLSGCFMFFRVSELSRLGGFNPSYFMYFEDTDITRKFYTASKAIFYPYVSVIHEHGQDSYKTFKMTWIHIVNMIRYFNKFGWFFDNERKIINRKIMKMKDPR